MTRAAAITHARTGASKLWAGTVVVQPNAKTGPHHHGEFETVLYIVRGRARMRWGDRLEFSGEAGPGDFIYVPPYVPHQEINALPGEPCEAVVVRSGQEPDRRESRPRKPGAGGQTAARRRSIRDKPHARWFRRMRRATTLDGMNRRYFLGSAISAGAALRSSALASPNDTVRVACVGVRGRGRDHIRAYSQMANVEIAAHLRHR